jgi:HK97 family phage portal protein
VSLLSAISERAKSWGRRSWPVGVGTVDAADRYWGHQDPYVPAEYGEYVATSNEVYSAASLRARLMSGLPLKLYRGRGNDKQLIESGPAVDLLRRVNPHWTWPRLARMDELAMCVWGKTFWALEPGRDGRPAEIWWLRADRCRPVPHETAYLDPETAYVYEPVMGGPLIEFRADEIVWFRYPHPLDEFSALSPLVAARLAADSASAMQKANKLLFDQGLLGGGLIVPATNKVDFSPEQARDLERQFASRMKGVDQAHRWAVLRFEAKVQALSISPRDAEFINGLGLNQRQICNAYGIPSPLLNDLGESNMAILAELVRAMWSHTLVPDAQLRSAEIVEQLLPRFAGMRDAPDYAEFDFGTVAALQESQSEAWAREAQALDRGAMTINEWRARQGLPRVEWGDVWWAPVNKSAVTDAASTPQGDTSPTGVGSIPGDGVDQVAAADTPRGIDHAAAELLATLRRPINGWRH